MSKTVTFFEPKTVNDYFMEITKRPHPSADQPNIPDGQNENPVREYVVEAAKELGISDYYYHPEATNPGERVVILRRPGSGNYKGKSPIVLQAHMDMVFNPQKMRFPLQVEFTNEDETWIKAKDANGKDSTLGADDGIGVATALAILADEDIKDYPLECLFTVEEETSMGGAQKFDVTEITGTRLLNLDAETLNIIYYGSAGGSATQFNGTILRKDCPSDYVYKEISISHLKGGHSGIAINKGRPNAIKLLDQALIRLNNRITELDVEGNGIGVYDFLLCDIQRTDVQKSNAIPAEASAIIALPGKVASDFEKDFNAYCETLKIQNLPEEDHFAFSCDTISPTGAAQRPMDEKSTNTILCMLQQVPHGVFSMIPEYPTIVETSSNLYNITINGNYVTILSSNRSSNFTSAQALSVIQTSIGTAFNFSVETGIGSYVSWTGDEDSKMLQVAKDVYAEKYGKNGYSATVVHAGLECGELASRFKNEKQVDLDAVSIGPTIVEPHTPKEELQVKSDDGRQTVQQFYDCVKEIIISLFK